MQQPGRRRCTQISQGPADEVYSLCLRQAEDRKVSTVSELTASLATGASYSVAACCALPRRFSACGFDYASGVCRQARLPLASRPAWQCCGVSGLVKPGEQVHSGTFLIRDEEDWTLKSPKRRVVQPEQTRKPISLCGSVRITRYLRQGSVLRSGRWGSCKRRVFVWTELKVVST